MVARCTVTRVMADIGLRGVQRGRKQFTTISDDTAARPADLVERHFVAERPNQLWLADITYVSTWEGWLYVAFILDVRSRMIVGWQLANHLRTDLVLDALEMALWRRDLTYGNLIHHSDRGSQYPSFRYSDRLAEVNVSASVGSRGDRNRAGRGGVIRQRSPHGLPTPPPPMPPPQVGPPPSAGVVKSSDHGRRGRIRRRSRRRSPDPRVGR